MLRSAEQKANRNRAGSAVLDDEAVVAVAALVCFMTALNYDTGLKPTAKYRLFEPPATVELSLISFGLCEQSSDGERASRAFPGTARWT